MGINSTFAWCMKACMSYKTLVFGMLFLYLALEIGLIMPYVALLILAIKNSFVSSEVKSSVNASLHKI